MTLRILAKAFGTALILAVTLAQTGQATIRHAETQKHAERQIRPNPVKMYGPHIPVTHRKATQTSDTLSARSGGVDLGISIGPWMDFVATAYDGQDDGMNGTASGLTSTGTHPRAWVTAAVDPNVIPYGSELQVELPDGSSVYMKAEDTGGAIRGNRIDIFIPSRAQCFQFGREHVLVRIISGK